MTILVTGGAGYIGSHVVRLLRDRGSEVVVVDDLSTGDAERVEGTVVHPLDLASDRALDELGGLLRSERVDTVVHFAARKRLGESIRRPAWYYRQNVGGLANLLSGMHEAGVSRLLFSSSAAVYAESAAAVTEDSATRPTNPYGETKLAGEWLAAAWARTGGAAVSLRYFNVAGAGWPHLADRLAENLVPMAIERVRAGLPPVIFGDDYPTPDGTCVRDYVHVMDLAEAHLAAIDRMADLGPGHSVFNVGTGRGASVREIVDAVLAASGTQLEPVVGERREGDLPSVVASTERIADRLGWRARFGIRDIVESAWTATAPATTGRPAT